MANVVTVSDTIPGWTPPAAQPFVQVDAPSGYCVVATYEHRSGTDPASAGYISYITDGDDLITGVVFTNGEYASSYTGYVQCLEIVP